MPMTMTMIPTQAVIQAQFADLGMGIRSLREPMHESIKTVVIPSIRENFESEGRPSWEPLSESRSAQKAAQGLPDDILVATGTLRRTATQLNIWDIDGGYGSGEAVASVDNLGNADYGFFHQEGTINMPERPFLMLQDEDLDGIVEVFEEYIAMRARRAGFV